MSRPTRRAELEAPLPRSYPAARSRRSRGREVTRRRRSTGPVRRRRRRRAPASSHRESPPVWRATDQVAEAEPGVSKLLACSPIMPERRVQQQPPSPRSTSTASSAQRPSDAAPADARRGVVCCQRRRPAAAGPTVCGPSDEHHRRRPRARRILAGSAPRRECRLWPRRKELTHRRRLSTLDAAATGSRRPADWTPPPQHEHERTRDRAPPEG
jgi:hypothetical protein